MQAHFIRTARRIVEEGATVAQGLGLHRTDYRAALCRWEDDLFAGFPEGHRLLSPGAAVGLVATVFEACGRLPPRLELVDGFEDPSVGGFADIDGHRILIEDGCLYRYLILHECAHLLAPADRHHGPAYISVLQALYRSFVGIPEATIRESLLRHGLPSRTALPEVAVAVAA